MEERRQRMPKKPEHPVREWISDNLRYFMLFGAILVVLLITGLGLKFLSGKTTGADQKKEETKAETSVSADNEEALDKDHMDTAETTPEPVVVPDVEEEKKEANLDDLTMEADGSKITDLVKKYFEGLSARNPQAVSECVDTFTEEDAQQVADNTQITSYKDVDVYTCEGTDDQSRVAFVSYYYTVAGSDAVIPALTQFYIYDTGNGNWKLAADTSDAAVQNRIDELSKTEAVQAMISTVRSEYDQVLSNHPELQ